MKARYEITHVPNLGVDWVRVQIDHGDGIIVEENQFGVREFPSLFQAEEVMPSEPPCGIRAGNGRTAR